MQLDSSFPYLRVYHTLDGTDYLGTPGLEEVKERALIPLFKSNLPESTLVSFLQNRMLLKLTNPQSKTTYYISSESLFNVSPILGQSLETLSPEQTYVAIAMRLAGLRDKYINAKKSVTTRDHLDWHLPVWNSVSETHSTRVVEYSRVNSIICPPNMAGSAYISKEGAGYFVIEGLEGCSSGRIPIVRLKRKEAIDPQDLVFEVGRDIYVSRPEIYENVLGVSPGSSEKIDSIIHKILLLKSGLNDSVNSKSEEILARFVDWQNLFFIGMTQLEKISTLWDAQKFGICNCVRFSRKVLPRSPFSFYLTIKKGVIFRIKSELGNGSFSKVKMAFSTERNQFFARKKISEKAYAKKSFMSAYNYKFFWSTEVSIYGEILEFNRKKIDLPGIAIPEMIISSEKDGRPVQEVLLPIFRMNLVQYILTQTLSIEQRKALFFSVLESINTFHTVLEWAHLDIKLDNLMIGYDGKIYLIDFGFARKQQDPEESAGSPGYYAPEMSKSGIPDHFARDAWATGIVLHAVLFSVFHPLAGVQFKSTCSIEFPVLVKKQQAQPKPSDFYEGIIWELLRPEIGERTKVADAYQKTKIYLTSQK